MSMEIVGKVGPKEAARGKRAVAASQHPIVTETMLQVMRDGGNAVDAGIAGCLVQATVRQDMTNHAGTVTFLYYEAKTGKTHQLNSSLGTPGNVHCTMPQVLSSILDYGMEPPEAVSVPRMDPMNDDYSLGIESRIPESVVAGLAKMGIRVKPHPKYDCHMGSFQVSWRDEKTGLLNSCSDPRRAGNADGF